MVGSVNKIIIEVHNHIHLLQVRIGVVGGVGGWGENIGGIRDLSNFVVLKTCVPFGSTSGVIQYFGATNSCFLLPRYKNNYLLNFYNFEYNVNKPDETWQE